ncbi:MAG: IS6 family transposase [Gammaproteobacteria bacterium]|jgi:putative transposase|nr:IS6 family transposase [Gammaproteobacteria bacterium]|tara:strand:- start:2623 stop:3321 length:699 start_codon:yes stop_codon:yes gene_type:complete
MNTSNRLYKRHRFPAEIIQYAVWLYFKFNLSHRDIEDLLAKRGIQVSYEAIRLWCNKFGPKYAKKLRKKHQGYGDTFFLDEVFIKINGRQHYLWRAVDQDGEVVDIYLQKRRDGKAAKRFFKRFLRKNKGEPRKIVTDKLRSYGVAHRELIPETIHDTSQYANNKSELSHQPTRVRERGMRKFKSIVQAQRFLNTHAAVYNLFNLGRHLVSAENYRYFRHRAFASWEKATTN